MLIENPKYDSLEKKTDKVFGKFTSFINKVAKEQVFKETDSSQKAPEPTLKQKMVQKFCTKFEEKFKSAYGVGQVR
jgi:cupin superfamily acireductone dioxygenase involved in methionine salvage